MFLQFLGTGAGIPSKNRNVASIALKLLDERNEVWLFDCGEATQHQILETTIRPRKITKIFITHMHGDHIFGLPGLLSSRAFQNGEEELTIYGPKGIKEYVMSALRLSHSHVKYPLSFIELSESGVAFEDKTFKVIYRTLKHGVPSYAYRVIEKDLPGELQVDRLKEYGIPSGPIYGQIKRGETVTLSDGRVLDGKAFIGPNKKGRQITIFGDTRYREEHVEFAKDSDVIVHEATYGKGEEKMANSYFHATCTQAAQLAHLANAKQLYLTHISSRYMTDAIKQLQKDAKSVFRQTKVVYDLFEVEVPYDE
ncbi:ribonuclease Z [Carnobacteriaceae bacterium zg-ZUI252]|nr:ribonuclease Z [Carnobacteriaceae bacterium zg-ZUI252]